VRQGAYHHRSTKLAVERVMKKKRFVAVLLAVTLLHHLSFSKDILSA